MNHHIRKSESAQASDWNQGSFDRELDRVLARYAMAEPRPGLEQRVLANLRAERRRAPLRAPWRWRVATALAAAVLAIVAIANWPSAKINESPQRAAIPPAPQVPITKRNAAARRVPRPGNSAHRESTLTVAVQPRLGQFPSRQPLTEQEKLLADYVAHFRDQAVLIARFNDEDLRRDRLEFIGQPQSSSDVTDFDNHETTVR